MLTALTALLTISCSPALKPLGPDGRVEVGLYAGDGSPVDVKTTLLSDGLKTSWSESDMLGVWAKTPAGSYALSNQKFVVYGKNDSKAYFTSVLESEMEDVPYTYYAVYPRPTSVSGTSATFALPSFQDGHASSADILVATPASYGALSSPSETGVNSNLSLEMNHMVHILNFFVPSEEDGEPVSRIEITLPFDCAGNVTADFTDPSVRPSVTSNGTGRITASLAVPAEPSSYVSVAICPPAKACGENDMLTATYYTPTRKVVAVPLKLSGRSFEPGHATPVKLVPESSVKSFRIRIKTGANLLGEALNSFSISGSEGEVYRYSNSEGLWSDISVDEEYLSDEGGEKFNSIVSAVSGGQGSVTFDSQSAAITVALSAANISVEGASATIDLGPIPYLLFEDFSSAKDYSQNGTYSAGANNDRTKDGYLLNGYMSTDGWNASRFVLSAGNNIMINCRYQSGGFISERICGRLDTPNIAALKPGVSVKLKFSFDIGCYIPVGYMLLGTLDDSGSNDQAFIKVGTHTKSIDSSIDCTDQSSIGDVCSLIYSSEHFSSDFGPSDFGADYPTMTLTASGCGPSTRFVIWACTERTTSAAGANSCYFYYIDNIKVSITN